MEPREQVSMSEKIAAAEQNRLREQFLMQQHDPMLTQKSHQVAKKFVDDLLRGEKITPADGMIALAVILEATFGRVFTGRGEPNPLRGFGNRWTVDVSDPAIREEINELITLK